MRFLGKVIISSFLIAGLSEIGKRSSVIAAILASLPITSILAILWLYWDTNDANKVGDLSMGIFWAVLPSLAFFLPLPILIKWGLAVPLAVFFSSITMVGVYANYVFLLKSLGVYF
jgi:hypothetical protein